MNYSAPLYLASSSSTRHWLLTQAGIPFQLLSQSADESSCDWNQTPHKVAASIARAKMEHVIMPQVPHACYVLTADTLCVDREGNLHGKPTSDEDALRMLKLWRSGSIVVTAYCLDKKRFEAGSWITEKRIEEVVTATVDFSIPDEWLEEYLTKTIARECAGGMTIEGYGSQFVRSIDGSYTAILGLPLCEVRTALTTLGFFIF